MALIAEKGNARPAESLDRKGAAAHDWSQSRESDFRLLTSGTLRINTLIYISNHHVCNNLSWQPKDANTLDLKAPASDPRLLWWQASKMDPSDPSPCSPSYTGQIWLMDPSDPSPRSPLLYRADLTYVTEIIQRVNSEPRSTRHCGFHRALSWIIPFVGSWAPCCKNAQTAPERVPHQKEQRPPNNSHEWAILEVIPPAPVKSQVTAVQADILTVMNPGQNHQQSYYRIPIIRNWGNIYCCFRPLCFSLLVTQQQITNTLALKPLTADRFSPWLNFSLAHNLFPNKLWPLGFCVHFCIIQFYQKSGPIGFLGPIGPKNPTLHIWSLLISFQSPHPPQPSK